MPPNRAIPTPGLDYDPTAEGFRQQSWKEHSRTTDEAIDLARAAIAKATQDTQGVTR